jgi:hypothetical protein
MKKPPEVLARCLPIPRLVGAADDDVKAGPTRLAKVVASTAEQRVQLLEFDGHGHACVLECARGERANLLLESFEIHTAFCENPVDERTRAAQEFGGRFRRDGYCC